MIENKKVKILVRVDGSKNIGLGHIYNMMTILTKFRNNHILVLMNKKKSLGKEKFVENSYDVEYFTNKKQLFEKIEKYKPDIIFNDILNTKVEYVKRLQKTISCIINFEDVGRGRKYSDLVINPIFSTKKKVKNEYYGGEFACVREEFRIGKKNQLRKKVKKICITLGGVDNKNNTKRVMEIIQKNELLKDVEINLILGFGFRYKMRLMKLINSMRNVGYRINIIEKTDFISRYIVDCDFAISSNGRTIFEIASLRNPIIALSVNARETEHSFVKYTKTGYQINTMKNSFEQELVEAIQKMCIYKTREIFHERLKKIDVKNGIERVFNLIKLTCKKNGIRS